VRKERKEYFSYKSKNLTAKSAKNISVIRAKT